jgi:hypothetical protein
MAGTDVMYLPDAFLQPISCIQDGLDAAPRQVVPQPLTANVQCCGVPRDEDYHLGDVRECKFAV